jgi:pimeloyl-ACP methyl ester carboxylesterase
MKVLFYFLSSLLAVVLSSSVLPAQPQKEPASGSPPSNIHIVVDPDKQTTTVLITARKDEVRWGDVLAGLARAKGFDDGAFADLMPDYAFPLSGFSTYLTIQAWNNSMPRGVHLRVVPAKKHGQERQLAITLDRAAMLATQRHFQKSLRDGAGQFVSFFCYQQPKEYGIRWAEGDEASSRPLVVLIPGFQSSPESLIFLKTELRQNGLAVGTFEYPNDQPLEDSARLLASRLTILAGKYPDRKIRLVAHSMGGLIARQVIEDAKSDPGNVDRLIMVATPNQGSRLAPFGFALEFWEHAVKGEEKTQLQQFYASIEDGLGEANEDLEPGSLFLDRLNACARNPGVRYSLFLGSGAILTPSSVQRFRADCKNLAAGYRFVRFFGPQLDSLLADLDEVITQKGDGVVAISRGQLAGVADVTLLGFDHLAPCRAPETEQERMLFAGILARIK